MKGQRMYQMKDVNREDWTGKDYQFCFSVVFSPYSIASYRCTSNSFIAENIGLMGHAKVSKSKPMKDYGNDGLGVRITQDMLDSYDIGTEFRLKFVADQKYHVCRITPLVLIEGKSGITNDRQKLFNLIRKRLQDQFLV